jgi:hypothetical protein
VSPIAAAWFDAWASRPPRSKDPKYRWAYSDAEVARKRADARPTVNVSASKAAQGKARPRARGGENSFLFGKAV